MPHNPAPTPPSRSPGDALSALLDTEKTLRARLDVANAEAQRILDAARATAADSERELETTWARELAALESTRTKALREEIALIESKARADRARFEGIGAAKINELATRVVALVMKA